MHMHRRHSTKDALWLASGLPFLAWATAEGAQPREPQAGRSPAQPAQGRTASAARAGAPTLH
jgi:hypothetical protein